MTKANPRIEIYYKEKRKRRWLRTGRVYRLADIVAAQRKMVELYKINNGRKEYELRPYIR